MMGFIYELKKAGIPIGVQYVLEFFQALRQGAAKDMDQLFLLSRLIFVKRVEHYDTFEQVFSRFFWGSRGEDPFVRWKELLHEKAFREWLRQQVDGEGSSVRNLKEMDTEELLSRFWQTLLDQAGEHHGGHRWIGTRGSSPFGHSAGRTAGGVRVYGSGRHGTAFKVIDQRRYINYSDRSVLGRENLQQVLSALKSLQPVGSETELDVEETIHRTAKNGGEIELVFKRELRNRLRLILLLDNGGSSMVPHVDLVKGVFQRVRDLFEDVKHYYFHNCIYGAVYADEQRTKPVKWDHLLRENSRTRLIIMGDANMAPFELLAAQGSLNPASHVRKPGMEWLRELRGAFPVSVWFNPIPRERWGWHSATISQIAGIFHMEDLTLEGIKRGVEHMNVQGKAFDCSSS